MLRFLHGYMDNYWDGLIKHGMIDDTSGVKLHQHIDVPRSMCFNEYAKKGSALYETVRECSRPFYVDRLQGGWWYEKYDYDRELLRTYGELCGEWMLGLQFHEWASNMSSDWSRIRGGMNGAMEYTEEAVKNAALMVSHIPGIKRSFTESASCAEYAAMRYPETLAETVAQYRALLAKRNRETNGNLLPSDSYYIAVRMEMEAGVKAFMPEIGAQIPGTRVQVALTRGMAKAYGKKWGTYYEPWGGNPFGCAYYKRDLRCEWYLQSRNSDLCGGFMPEGGSSRHLQKRLYWYSLLSGATFMSEEYGTCNTFHDWNEFELTPYGKIKRDFIQFQRKYPADAKPYTPVAIVLTKEFEIFDLNRDAYLGFPLGANAAYRRAYMFRILDGIFAYHGEVHGNESHILANSSYGDVFDIVYEDVGEAVLSKYDLIVSTASDRSLSFLYPNLTDKIIENSDIRALFNELDTRLPTLLPFTVEGNISYILNSRDDGSWMLGLFNNDGVFRNMKGETVYPEADAVVSVSGKIENVEISEGDTKHLLRETDGHYRYTVSAGTVAVLIVE